MRCMSADVWKLSEEARCYQACVTGTSTANAHTLRAFPASFPTTLQRDAVLAHCVGKEPRCGRKRNALTACVQQGSWSEEEQGRHQQHSGTENVDGVNKQGSEGTW